MQLSDELGGSRTGKSVISQGVDGIGLYLGHCQRRPAHLRFFCVTAHTLAKLGFAMVVRLTSTVSELTSNSFHVITLGAIYIRFRIPLGGGETEPGPLQHPS